MNAKALWHVVSHEGKPWYVLKSYYRADGVLVYDHWNVVHTAQMLLTDHVIRTTQNQGHEWSHNLQAWDKYLQTIGYIITSGCKCKRLLRSKGVKI